MSLHAPQLKSAVHCLWLHYSGKDSQDMPTTPKSECLLGINLFGGISVSDKTKLLI
jgi:hypothetical protein